MKKQLFSLSFCLALASSVIASNVDEKIFLEPHLAHLAGKAVFNAGHELAPSQLHTFEHALSQNIGTSLPSTVHRVSKSDCRVIGLAAHMKQIADSLKGNGSAIITAPASYGVLFTTGGASKEDVMKKIHGALEKIGKSEDGQFIAAQLSELKEVSHATFARREGKLSLVTDEKTISLGERVWRKTPEGARQEIFHSEEEFLVAIRDAGLFCEEIKRPCFFGEVKWQAYNKNKQESDHLGSAYMDHHPFTIYKVVKKAA
jgi:hypothetical protein